jgi:hypothetical protein
MTERLFGTVGAGGRENRWVRDAFELVAQFHQPLRCLWVNVAALPVDSLPQADRKAMLGQTESHENVVVAHAAVRQPADHEGQQFVILAVDPRSPLLIHR